MINKIWFESITYDHTLTFGPRFARLLLNFAENLMVDTVSYSNVEIIPEVISEHDKAEAEVEALCRLIHESRQVVWGDFFLGRKNETSGYDGTISLQSRVELYRATISVVDNSAIFVYTQDEAKLQFFAGLGGKVVSGNIEELVFSTG